MTDPIVIEQDIVSQRVSAEAESNVPPVIVNTLESIDESFKRPNMLLGATYKVKSPLEEDAIYVTINDVVLNRGTTDESRRPYEIFINSKNTTNQQWVTVITRLISAVFRKGGSYEFMVDEMLSVTDPNGGFRQGSKWVPSVVALIGLAVQEHFSMLKETEQSKFTLEQQALVDAKKEELGMEHGSTNYPESATTCSKCGEIAVVLMDGCSTCLACADSKCG